VRRRRRAASGLLLAALALPAQALAAPPCPSPLPEPNYLVEGETTLESVIVDYRGRLFFTNSTSVLRLDGREAKPKVLAEVEEPGGLAFDGDGGLLVGTGNSAGNGSHGDVDGPSSLTKVDPDTGAAKVYATGLSMGNGLVRGPDGSFYASNDFGSNIDRITGGETERGWAKVDSGNGLVIDSSGRYLYAAQTFRPAAIARVDLADPSAVTTYVAADEADMSAGLDGLAIDAADNIFAAANGAGEIWKVPRANDGSAERPCVLLPDLPPFPDGPSAVAVGVGSGPFGAGNLYAVTFDGNVIELPGTAVPSAAPPRLYLRVQPRSVRRGKRRRFAFQAVVASDGVTYPARGAVVRFAGKRRRADARGRAFVRARFRRTGRVQARVAQGGVRGARVSIRVR
jgi:sugar lactone lactonase YvrE